MLARGGRLLGFVQPPRAAQLPVRAAFAPRWFSTGSGRVLVIAEHNNKQLNNASLSAVAAASKLGGDVTVLVAGHGCADVAKQVHSA